MRKFPKIDPEFCGNPARRFAARRKSILNLVRKYVCAKEISLLNEESTSGMRQPMQPLELKPGDLPMTVRLKTRDGAKDYVLVMTKQEKLLLNKPLENTRAR